jgi:hypothetical protein
MIKLILQNNIKKFDNGKNYFNLKNSKNLYRGSFTMDNKWNMFY